MGAARCFHRHKITCHLFIKAGCYGLHQFFQVDFLQSILRQRQFSAEEVKPEASFVEDLGADSLDLTELIMAMEEAFDVEIADDDAQKILKVKDAISYVQNHTN